MRNSAAATKAARCDTIARDTPQRVARQCETSGGVLQTAVCACTCNHALFMPQLSVQHVMISFGSATYIHNSHGHKEGDVHKNTAGYG